MIASDLLINNEFSRNIGLLSIDQQRQLLNSRVAVVGAGGVGGLHILTLARLGVGAFHIADPDIFEAANISRQFGASQKTLGRNKAVVLAEMVHDINPQAEVVIFPEGISADNADRFLDNCQVLVDGIDFFALEIRRLLFCRARENGIYAITCAPLGFGSTLQVFAPNGMNFDEYFATSDKLTFTQNLAAFAAGLAPSPYHIKYMDLDKVDISKQKGPAVAPACTLAASLLSTEVVKIITGSQKVCAVPHYIQIDMYRRKLKKGYLLWGGKNPLQRFKTWLIFRQFCKRLEDHS
jgi:molybdopterin/thiamine biosynthesis adenylyltransferase